MPQNRLDPRDVLGFCALRVFDDLKLHGLTLGQCFESFTLDGRKVNEYVRSALLLDEAEPLLFIEPFHSAACHVLLPPSGMLLARKFTLNSLWGESLWKIKNRAYPLGASPVRLRI